MNKSLILNRIKSAYNLKNNAELSRFLGVAPNTLTNWYNRNSIDFDLIFTKCENINADWLLTGYGEMIRKTKESKYTIPEKEEMCVKEDKVEYPYNGSKSIFSNEKEIPLVSIEAVAGFGGSGFSIAKQDIQALYKVPDFNGIDFMIRVKGSSMYPKYASGDIVACRILKESNFIEWNKPHVIATTEHGLIVKRLRKSEKENYLTAISDNPSYDPFEIPKEEITGIAIIIGVIRLE